MSHYLISLVFLQKSLICSLSIFDPEKSILHPAAYELLETEIWYLLPAQNFPNIFQYTQNKIQISLHELQSL